MPAATIAQRAAQFASAAPRAAISPAAVHDLTAALSAMDFMADKVATEISARGITWEMERAHLHYRATRALVVLGPEHHINTLAILVTMANRRMAQGLTPHQAVMYLLTTL